MGDARPDTWLPDYYTPCVTSDGDEFVAIHTLPLHLAESARAWLTSLPEGCIRDWRDLEDIFVKNFQGTYKRPGNAWDLQLCAQQDGKSLRDYIQCFSQKKNSLSGVYEADIITAFSKGVQDLALTHKIGRKASQTAGEIFDIANAYATGEEVVLSKGKDNKGKSKGNPESSKPKGGPEPSKKNNT